MIVLLATPGLDPYIGDSGVFRSVVVRKDDQFADRLERWLAGSRRAEDAAVGPLPVERETGPIALCADKLEFPLRYPLRDTWIEVKEGVNVSAVTRQFL